MKKFYYLPIMALMAILPSCQDNVEDDNRVIWDFANYG